MQPVGGRRIDGRQPGVQGVVARLGGFGFESQALAFAQLLAGHNVHFSPESGDKVVRATPLASQINAGNVVMVKGAWNDPFKEECRLFSNEEGVSTNGPYRSVRLAIRINPKVVLQFKDEILKGTI